MHRENTRAATTWGVLRFSTEVATELLSRKDAFSESEKGQRTQQQNDICDVLLWRFDAGSWLTRCATAGGLEG